MQARWSQRCSWRPKCAQDSLVRLVCTCSLDEFLVFPGVLGLAETGDLRPRRVGGRARGARPAAGGLEPGGAGGDGRHARTFFWIVSSFSILFFKNTTKGKALVPLPTGLRHTCVLF